MRQAVLLLIVSMLCGLHPSEGWALQIRTLPATVPIGHEVIVGRAHCLGSTWLLTDVPALTRISADSLSVSSSPLSGLRQGEKPWGLACLPTTHLWTIVSHLVLARLSPDGLIVERIGLDRPRLGIYTAGERLLLQHPPARVGQPLLAAGLPTKLSAFVQWPAPAAQHAATQEEQVRANLVSCGIGAAGYVPCWLVSQSRVAIGDGTPAHTAVLEFRFVRSATVDATVPIWDVALAGPSRVWVLASARAAPDGRRLGGRLTRSNRRADDEGFVDVRPFPRLILWAGDDRCVLLSETGQLLEVSAP